jgi:hypothetical protein
MSKKTTAIIAVLGLWLGAGPAGAGELEPSELAPDANWVVHLDQEALRSSSIGQLVLAELEKQGLTQKLDSFATVFGFHPIDDIRDVTVYGVGQDQEKAVVLADARFNQDKLVALVRMNPQHQEIPHGNTTIHRWLQEDKDNTGEDGEPATKMMYGCIHDGRVVVLSAGLDAVKKAADILSNAAAGAPAELAERASTRQGTFFQVIGTGVGAMLGNEPKAAVLREAEALTLAAGDDEGQWFVEVALEGKSVEVAQNMAKMLEGVIALAKLAGQEQPELVALAEKVRISSAGKVTQVLFEAEVQTMLDLLKNRWEQDRQQQEGTPTS